MTYTPPHSNPKYEVWSKVNFLAEDPFKSEEKNSRTHSAQKLKSEADGWIQNWPNLLPSSSLHCLTFSIYICAANNFLRAISCKSDVWFTNEIFLLLWPAQYTVPVFNLVHCRCHITFHLLVFSAEYENYRRHSRGTLRQKKTWLNLIWASISISQALASISISFSINQNINQHQSALVGITVAAKNKK